MSCSRTSDGCEGFCCSMFSYRLWVFCTFCTCSAVVCSPGRRRFPSICKAVVPRLRWYDAGDRWTLPTTPVYCPFWARGCILCSLEISLKVPHRGSLPPGRNWDFHHCCEDDRIPGYGYFPQFSMWL